MREGAILQSPCPSVHTFVKDVSAVTGRKDFIFDTWLWHSNFVPCLPFPGLPHINFLFTARLRIFHVCRNENFRNRYLSFYWKKWFYIWYMGFAWWIVLCLPFPGLPHIYFLFTVRLKFSGNECWDIYKFDTNERVGVFLALRSVQHLVFIHDQQHITHGK